MRPRDRAALVLVAVALAFACLAVGGAPRWAAGVSALLGLASATPYLASRRTASRPPALLWPLGLAAALTLLQLLPLPVSLAEQLAPAKLALVRDNAAAWGEAAPAWIVASFDPPATLLALATLVGHLGLAWTCVRLASNRRARRWLAAVAGGVAVAVAVVTLGHEVVGARRLYGLLDPGFTPAILGPLLGVNQLAALLALAAPVLLALAVRAAGLARLGWLAAGASVTGVALLTGSRGGAVGLAAGLLVTVAVLVVQRRAGPEPSRRVPLAVSLPVAAVAACCMVLLAMLTAGDVARDLAATSVEELTRPESRLHLWERSGALVGENRWLGVGHGAFEQAFTAHATSGAVTFSHAENSYLQAILDWGLPGGMAMLGVLALAALAALRRWREGPLEAGALGALASLAVHEIADFATDVPAVAMLAIAAAAPLWPARLGTATAPGGGRAERAPGPVVAARAAALAAGAAVVLLALAPVGRPARADAAAIAAAPPAARVAEARAAMTRHPADYQVAGRAAEALLAARDDRGVPDPRALKVLRRALAMHPLHPGLRHLAGRMLLLGSRPAQAADEYALAIRWTPDVRPLVAEVLRAFSTPALAARALPAEPPRAWQVFAALEGATAPRLAYAQRVAERAPRDAGMQYLLSAAASDAGRPDLAVPAGREAYGRQPVARHATAYARALAAAGDLAGAVALLEEAAGRDAASPLGERCSLLFVLAGLQEERADPAAARTTLERALELAGDDRRLRRDAHERLAALEDRAGNRNQATWHRQRAAEQAAP